MNLDHPTFQNTRLKMSYIIRLVDGWLEDTRHEFNTFLRQQYETDPQLLFLKKNLLHVGREKPKFLALFIYLLTNAYDVDEMCICDTTDIKILTNLILDNDFEKETADILSLHFL